MKNLDHVYITLFAQFLLIVFTALYLIFTIQVYPLNYIWFLVAMLLIMFGFMLDLLPALIISLFVVFGYSSFILYQIFFAKSAAEIVLNDMVWLLLFPVSAAASGLLGRSFRQLANGYRHYADNFEKLVVVDELTGFLNFRNFMQELQDEASRSSRYGREMCLLLVEISYFKELTKEYGKEQSQEFIRKVADGIEEALRDVDKKAYLDDGRFGLILPETPPGGLQIVINRINDKFQNAILNRDKREVKIKLRLKFGSAMCPQQGTEADAIYERAKQELNLYVG